MSAPVRATLVAQLTLATFLVSGCSTDSTAQTDPREQGQPNASHAALETRSSEVAALMAGAAGRAGQPIDERGYAGAFEHPGGSECRTCHAPDLDTDVGPDSDLWMPDVATCDPCHQGIESPSQVRRADRPDHDGDGDSAEPLEAELDDLLAALMQAIQARSNTTGQPICYHPQRYPHWMKDLDGDGTCSEGEAKASNAYEVWTEPMLRASSNYQVVAQDRGAWAHNFDYSAQLLIDAIQALGGDTSRFVRPK
jgi:hypothetical protein